MNLECENCGCNIFSEACAACGEPCPSWAKFCPHCGVVIERKKSKGDPYALENRRLCSDGNCIGIIGHNGRCTECGRPG